MNIVKDPNDIFLEILQKNNFDKNELEKIFKIYDINLNHTNQNNQTFLHICLENNKVDSAIWLLQKKIDVNRYDRNGQTPFDIAIEHKNHRVIDLILKVSDIDINKKDRFGRTLLQDAVMLGDHEMAKILLQHDADINSKDAQGRNVIFDAISYGNTEFIDHLLTFKKLELNNIDIDGNTILHHSLVKENNPLAIKLIKHGANPNIKDEEGNSFLSISALRGIVGFEIIETAIKEGFDINAKVANENSILIEVMLAFSTVLDKSRRESLFLMSKKLIESGIDINAVNANGENALFQAIRIEDKEQISMLLESGIMVNLQNNNGETPLALTAFGGSEKVDILILLLKCGADPTIKNKKGKTLFEVLNEIILSNHGNKELKDNDILKHALAGSKFMLVLKEILKYYEGDINFLDSTGKPIFYMPLLYNNLHLYKLYVKAGVDLQTLTKRGKNLFFEYVVKVFEDNNPDIDFHSALSMLISSKINHNTVDETGWTVVSKVIANTKCNLELFKTLVKVVRFDYRIVDKLGRTAFHTAVWSSNINVMKIIDLIDRDIKNIPDCYGILPSIYAALLGNKNLVLYFISAKAKIKTDIPISKAAIKKFSPLLKNIEKLTADIENESDLRNIKIVIRQLQKDFVL